MEKPVKKHQEIELSISDLAYGGAGLAHIDDFVIFVKNGIPGQKVKARITKVKSSFAEAKILNIIEQSPQFQASPCIYFDHCGGCTHQHLDYETQLRYLHKQVIDLYSHLGGFGPVDVLPPVPSQGIFRYRNKMEFAFSEKRWLIDDFETYKPENFALGLRAPGNYWKAIDLNDCLIAPEETSVVLATIRQFALSNQLAAFNQKNHTGFLRHLVLRKAYNTNQLMINIVTNNDQHAIFQPLVNELSAKLDNLSCVVNTITRGWSGTTVGEKQHTIFGNDHILEMLGALTFKISPASFFQTNTIMAEKLYEIVREYASISKTNTVWDLYCGTGSIALYLARDAKEIIGFEIVKDAVKDALVNASLNNIKNTRFIEGDLDKLFQKNPEILDDLPKPDILIVDPPRGGMHPKLVDVVAQLHPKTIVYVSCNPATQVRDIKMLLEQKHYTIDKIQPVDLFPHTPHIEVVTKLTAA
ncbi:23S rRNA (uracil(1939)-C(5))-methyltransferase RlmD [bacterium]|nr:23S rRNA (uracil(1939)-C(5))-methyltransferase RlmD [bacterium]MBU1064409.1 23S rRNA (uracil(1939)-C(5))-methyltransferase RlmD [bacterium]MBU1633656.1 23S rRNA (uracil(1939)-C(5))-methyltransferase RlmD [bacterium]MBU1873554.1 23S rRNA (uracil(1939)-C(5))-methyltransferase RlmD [bacterium]